MHVQTIHAAAASLQLTIPATYGYVLLVAVVIALEIIVIGFVFPGGARGQAFTKQFMEENFGTEHQAATGVAIEKGGYPDMGSGRYSQKLPYKQWFAFNNAQRAHYNFIQMAPSTFVFLLIAGVYFPIPSAAIGLALAIGRVIYSIGYAKGGPKGRLIGALINDFTLLGLLGLSFASAIMLINGNSNN